MPPEIKETTCRIFWEVFDKFQNNPFNEFYFCFLVKNSGFKILWIIVSIGRSGNEISNHYSICLDS